ncbi:MAG TPA: beta-propeller domain-containing protein, partial [Fusibacter sp.]|nr:beta-propeller domain-containing protein [Fusibacter sp.]
MLKKIVIFTILALMCWLPSFADDTIRIEIDGKPLVLEVAPQIENGRTLVPFKAIFEALGLKIDWVSGERIATAYNADMNVSIKIDAAYGNINGELIPLEAPGKIVDGRTLVPLKFISEAFGNEVVWNPDKRLVSIKSGFKPYVYTEALPTVGSLEKLKLILAYAGKYTQYIYPIREDGVLEPTPDGKGGDTPVAQPEAAPSAVPDYSSTNVQVEGVDEADIVKTDGNTIYQLRAQDLKITDISTGTMKTLATIKFEEFSGATEFYLYEDKLIVIGNSQIFYPMLEKFAPSIMPMPQVTPKTHIYFYDVSNPAKPVLIRKYEGEGNYMTSRLTGGKLYMVMNK